MLAPLGEALRIILKKVADFFDLFDLSFFVAGGSCLAALLFFAHAVDPDLLFGEGSSRLLQDAGPGTALVAALLVYVLGLGCFAVGRVLRKPLMRLVPGGRFGEDYTVPFPERLAAAAVGHGLQDDPIVGPYLSPDGKTARPHLYDRLWAEVRERPDLAESYELLRRFWIMAATYDGVAFSAILWAGVLCAGLSPALHSPLGPTLVGSLAIANLLMALACLHEASRYSKTQMNELFATIAHLRQRRAEGSVQETSPAAPSTPPAGSDDDPLAAEPAGGPTGGFPEFGD